MKRFIHTRAPPVAVIGSYEGLEKDLISQLGVYLGPFELTAIKTNCQIQKRRVDVGTNPIQVLVITYRFP